MTTITLPAPSTPTTPNRADRSSPKDLPLTTLALLVALAATLVVGGLDDESSGSAEVLGLDDVTAAIGADAAWSAGVTGEGIRVALLDSGISPVGPLEGRVVGSGGDAVGHGTHLAGIVAAVAPGSTLVDVNVAGAEGEPSVQRFLESLRAIVGGEIVADVVVIAAELEATPLQQAAYAELVREVTEAGTVIVAAAGNRSTAGAGLDWTATPPEVIAVGGAEQRGGWQVPAWSATGTSVRLPDLVAPGASVVSVLAPDSAAATDPTAVRVGEEMIRGSGTSQAAAVVAGAVALLAEADPQLTTAGARVRLTSSAQPMPEARPTAQGAGLLDLRSLFALGDGAPTSSWTGNSWTGNSWTGNSWTGNSWTGNSWTGNSWTGNSWTGNSWTGNSWTGN
ncbi:MAG: S8 family serine peptidase, partial [Actinomycetota bacterium]